MEQAWLLGGGRGGTEVPPDSFLGLAQSLAFFSLVSSRLHSSCCVMSSVTLKWLKRHHYERKYTPGMLSSEVPAEEEGEVAGRREMELQQVQRASPHGRPRPGPASALGSWAPAVPVRPGRCTWSGSFIAPFASHVRIRATAQDPGSWRRMPWGTGGPAEMSSAWHRPVLAGAVGREAQGWEPAESSWPRLCFRRGCSLRAAVHSVS